MIKEVLIVFKTHLDIGFTDYAKNVTKKYLESYLPEAVDFAYRQKDTNYPFVWTTGSWLIYEALKKDNDGKLEKAIRDGLINWHALPFTSHTEYMNRELMEYALSLSEKLDKRFGRKTIAAKMSDVPGHTAAMIPILTKAGVELIHIGVNPATPIPDVPEIFTWKFGDSSINVMYNGGGYGKTFEIDDFAVAFGMTGDNHGPQDAEGLKNTYETLKNQYPGAVIRAATLDDVAKKIRGRKFPVIENEIGDNWIHGVGTDPTKTRAFRAILRNLKNYKDYELSDNLLLVPEHTWGMNLNIFFPDRETYLPDELKNCTAKEKFESSWAEQREYITKALNETGLDISEDMKVEIPDTSGMTVSTEKCSAEVSYQLFNSEDYERYRKDYLQSEVDWAEWDFLKLGLPEYESGIFSAETVQAWEKDGLKIFKMEFPEKIKSFCGLPVIFVLENGENIEVRWFGKTANRLPEAYWIKLTDAGECVKIKKLDEYVDVSGALGMRNLHAMQGVLTDKCEIESLDAPLAAPYGRHMLEWSGEKHEKDLYFNLYNNIWNTNFPMWFSDDAKFRFIKRG